MMAVYSNLLFQETVQLTGSLNLERSLELSKGSMVEGASSPRSHQGLIRQQLQNHSLRNIPSSI